MVLVYCDVSGGVVLVLFDFGWLGLLFLVVWLGCWLVVALFGWLGLVLICGMLVCGLFAMVCVCFFGFCYGGLSLVCFLVMLLVDCGCAFAAGGWCLSGCLVGVTSAFELWVGGRVRVFHFLVVWLLDFVGFDSGSCCVIGDLVLHFAGFMVWWLRWWRCWVG